MSSNSLFEFDKSFEKLIIGTDEAGRGPGAGGVFASAVCFLNVDVELIENLTFLNDSKKLSRVKREDLYDVILKNTINSTVCIEVQEIEEINILNASLKAMRLACENVLAQIEKKSDVLVLVDGNKLIKEFPPSPQPLPLTKCSQDIPFGRVLKGEGFQYLSTKDGKNKSRIIQKCIIKGDSKSASIAAASILAKVSRDRYMLELAQKYPQYNWQKNAGYLTKEHLDAIDKFGITEFHRKSFLRKHNAKQLSFL